MTHEYTILIGGLVLRGGGAAACTAIAWASDTVLALGSDAEVLAISRGDSSVVALGGRTITPADDGGVLEVGGPADLVVLGEGVVEVLIRGGEVVAGSRPGLVAHEHEHDHEHSTLVNGVRD